MENVSGVKKKSKWKETGGVVDYFALDAEIRL
jgi:hypothetical protein